MVMYIKKLLLIHGYTSNMQSMQKIKNKLQYYYDEIILIDIPGHGNNNLKFNLKNTIDYCISIYDSISKRAKVDICGHSLGGMIASYIASIRNVNRLILLAPSFQILLNINALKPNDRFINLRKTPSPIGFYSVYSYIKSNIWNIYCPCLVIFGEDDRVVSKGSIDFILTRVKNKKIAIIYKNVDHISIVESDNVINGIIKFVNE